jgi:FtsZ-binding cell division protein ZapB
MATQHREHYRITASDETDRALASVKRGFEQVEGAISGVQRATAGLAGIAAAALSVNHFLQAAAGAEQSSNRLAAALRATGQVAGYTREQLDSMAEGMAESTLFDDDAIRDAMSTLIKFGNIQGEVFTNGMKLAADYASFTGGSIEDAAQTIGKALQSPEEGVGALERQIGKLSVTQKENIKTFMEQGRVMDAQAVVLDALQKRIGGTSDLINTGLTKSLNDIKKNFGEFSEVVGKSAPADSFLGFINQSLKDMKQIIESGDWVAALKFIAGFRGMDIKATQNPTASSGIIRGGPQDPKILALQAEIDAAMEAARRKQSGSGKAKAVKPEMTFDELMARAAMKRAQMEDEANERAEKAAEDLRKENERLLESVIDLIDPTAQYSRQIEIYRKAMDDGVISVEQFIEAATVLQGKITEIRERNQQVKEETKAVDDVARDLGLTFTSAFEEAIVQGKELREVMRGLLMDIAKIAVRKTVTEPIGGAISSLVKAGVGAVLGGGGGWTGSGDMDLPSFDGGGFTGGGSRSGGVDGRGGFLGVLHPNETVLDHSRGASGSGVIRQTINFSANTPAAVRDAVFALAPQLTAASVAAVRAERNRSGDRR